MRAVTVTARILQQEWCSDRGDVLLAATCCHHADQTGAEDGDAERFGHQGCTGCADFENGRRAILSAVVDDRVGGAGQIDDIGHLTGRTFDRAAEIDAALIDAQAVVMGERQHRAGCQRAEIERVPGAVLVTGGAAAGIQKVGESGEVGNGAAVHHARPAIAGDVRAAEPEGAVLVAGRAIVLGGFVVEIDRSGVGERGLCRVTAGKRIGAGCGEAAGA